MTSLGEDDEFNAWHVTETPGGIAEIGRATCPADVAHIRVGISAAEGYRLHSGFPTRQAAETFIASKGLQLTDG